MVVALKHKAQLVLSEVGGQGFSATGVGAGAAKGGWGGGWWWGGVVQQRKELLQL